MICRVQALNYRCLKYVDQRLERFAILVGPNASGKTTFLDVVSFLGRLVSDDIDAAVEERTTGFNDLVWGRSGDRFELAIEALIPDSIRKQTAHSQCDVVRYEVGIGLNRVENEIHILGEKVILRESKPGSQKPHELFTVATAAPDTILTNRVQKGSFTVVSKVSGGNDNFHPEAGGSFSPAFKLGPRKSALKNLPEDETSFPVATWLKGLLSRGVQQLVLNSRSMRFPCPPGQGKTFQDDGSNLPWMIELLKKNNPERAGEWLKHLKTALPNITDIEIMTRPEDNSRHLVICYENDLKVPSWMVSDGTLRFIALTLPAYLPKSNGIFLVEEPENGIHPRAIEPMIQSLSSVYHAQVLIATHSPVVLGVADLDTVLCFSRTKEYGTEVVPGNKHPLLKDWDEQTSLSTLFASGVLG